MALSLTEKHRPRVLSQIVGNEKELEVVSGMLKCAPKHLRKAVLVTGPYGCGKTSLARVLARTVNCEVSGPNEACGKCDTCRGVQHPDIIEIDAASDNGVDAARALKVRQALKPLAGRYRVYILDESHKMTPAAWSALLKVVEDPSPRTIFIFVTTELGLIPNTIRSRCMHIQLRLASPKDIFRYLRRINKKEKMNLPKKALLAIAKSSGGHVRDAVVFLEKVFFSMQARGGYSKNLESQLLEVIEETVQTAPYQILRNYLMAVLAGRSAQALDVIQVFNEYEFFFKAVADALKNLCLYIVQPNLCSSQYRALFEKSNVTISPNKAEAMLASGANAYEKLKQYILPPDILAIGLTIKLSEIVKNSKKE